MSEYILKVSAMLYKEETSESVIDGKVIGELIRCKDCKHRPTITINGKYENNGFDLEFPDYKCPCQCDDGYYSWMPDDDWFCGNGERKEEC